MIKHHNQSNLFQLTTFRSHSTAEEIQTGTQARAWSRSWSRDHGGVTYWFAPCGFRWKTRRLLFWKQQRSWAHNCRLCGLPWKLPPLLTSVSSHCRRMPSLLEYISYTCNFMGILAGPLCSYKDYITFIEGRPSHVAQSSENGKEEQQHERADPSPNVRAWDSSGALCFTASASLSDFLKNKCNVFTWLNFPINLFLFSFLPVCMQARARVCVLLRIESRAFPGPCSNVLRQMIPLLSCISVFHSPAPFFLLLLF